jgi:pyruvate dehydrogenase E1 component alpha subunit
MVTKQFLIDFEDDIAQCFLDKKIRTPVHLSDGNEDILIEIFKLINKNDWVFSTWRSHYHALLHGVEPSLLKQEILNGHSISLNFSNPKLFTSAIVGGICPIALGAAKALQLKELKQKVWCFIGDATYHTGIYHECKTYAIGHILPIQFVIEDNMLSAGSPTYTTWGTIPRGQNKNGDPYTYLNSHEIYYSYTKNKYPHVGCGEFVTF